MIAHQAALAIMDWFQKAEKDLVGSTVITFRGDIGTVLGLKLDEHHGLCFTLDPVSQITRFYPVSTIRTKNVKC